MLKAREADLVEGFREIITAEGLGVGCGGQVFVAEELVWKWAQRVLFATCDLLCTALNIPTDATVTVSVVARGKEEPTAPEVNQGDVVETSLASDEEGADVEGAGEGDVADSDAQADEEGADEEGADDASTLKQAKYKERERYVESLREEAGA